MLRKRELKEKPPKSQSELVYRIKELEKDKYERGGCPYDNSCVEGFFALLKKECIYRRKYSTIEELESDIFTQPRVVL